MHHPSQASKLTFNDILEAKSKFCTLWYLGGCMPGIVSSEVYINRQTQHQMSYLTTPKKQDIKCMGWHTPTGYKPRSSENHESIRRLGAEISTSTDGLRGGYQTGHICASTLERFR